MKKFRISKIRPVSWRISVQGEDGTEYVRKLLAKMNFQTSEPTAEPGLTEPPVYSFVASSGEDAPLTPEELEAILDHDARVELEFERR